jgi:DNA mismatch endonuclease (patch repair protein)
MLATRRRDTPAETDLRRRLFAAGLRYRVDVAVGGVRSRADIAFPGPKVAVFVDGCFWHGCPEHGTWPKANSEWWRAKIEGNRRRDADATQQLRDAGWTVLRFWTHDDMKLAAETVMRAVRASKP